MIKETTFFKDNRNHACKWGKKIDAEQDLKQK